MLWRKLKRWSLLMSGLNVIMSWFVLCLLLRLMSCEFFVIRYVIIQCSDYQVSNTKTDLSVGVHSAGTIRVWVTRRSRGGTSREKEGACLERKWSVIQSSDQRRRGAVSIVLWVPTSFNNNLFNNLVGLCNNLIFNIFIYLIFL